MRDMTITARIAIIVALLASLLLLMRQCGSDPAMVTTGGDGQGEGREKGKESASVWTFYPIVPETVPDLNDGYVFNEDRYLEESDLDDPVLSRGGSDTIDIEEVVYSGSVIVGDLQKALIAYQEAAPVKRRSGMVAARSTKQQRSAKSTYKHKQLIVGDIFKGFKVVIIEEDRIVFEKGKEKIEKFLFDASKERVEIKSSSTSTKSVTAPKQGTAKVVPPKQVKPGEKPPQARTPSSAAFRLRAPNIGPDGQEKPIVPQNVRKRRSQRLLSVDPSFVAPQPPGGAN